MSEAKPTNATRVAATWASMIFLVVMSTILMFFYDWKAGLVMVATDVVGAICIGVFFGIKEDLEKANKKKGFS